MEVQIISNTVQKFNGESFYLCGQYFQHKGKRLHRTVWEYHNGEIPDGYHIHHKDADRSNNQISNLELVLAEKHLSNHMNTPERKAQSRIDIKGAIEAAREWHGTKQGAEWHSKHAKEYWENAPLNTYVCTYCGKEYQSKVVRYKGNFFCCANHKAAFHRERLKNESKEHNICG